MTWIIVSSVIVICLKRGQNHPASPIKKHIGPSTLKRQKHLKATMHCMLAFNICPLFSTRQIEIQFIEMFELA